SGCRSDASARLHRLAPMASLHVRLPLPEKRIAYIRQSRAGRSPMTSRSRGRAVQRKSAAIFARQIESLVFAATNPHELDSYVPRRDSAVSSQERNAK